LEEECLWKPPTNILNLMNNGAIKHAGNDKEDHAEICLQIGFSFNSKEAYIKKYMRKT